MTTAGMHGKPCQFNGESGERRAMRSRTIAFLVTAIAAGSVLAYGIFRGEFAKVLFNAATL